MTGADLRLSQSTKVQEPPTAHQQKRISEELKGQYKNIITRIKNNKDQQSI